MPQITKRLAREIAKILHEVGTATGDGLLLVDPEVVHGRVGQLDFDSRPASGRDAARDDEQDIDEDDTDPAAVGRAIGRKQREAREKAADLTRR